MADFSHEIDNWVSGVITSMEGDKISDDALLTAKNTQLVKTAPGNASLGTRPGWTKATTFRLINGLNNAKYVAPYSYAVNNATAFSEYLAIVDEQGYLYFKDPDDSWDQTVYGPTSIGDVYYPFFLPTQYLDNIDSTIMNNRMFFTAGPGRRSLLGKTIVPFGIDPPSVTASAVTVRDFTLGDPYRALTFNPPTDVYDVFASSYDSRTGAESNPQLVGSISVTNGTNIIKIVLNGTQVVDSWKVYIRRQSTQVNAYLATTLLDTSAMLVNSTGVMPVAKNTVYFNATAQEIADSIIAMPSLTDNSPLNSEAIYLATYGRRMIGASRRKIFYSKLDQPESFPPQNFEIVDVGNGAEITGLLPVEDELLLIFTNKGVWGLFGIDPQYWVLKPISTSIGCVNKKSVIKFDGGVAWWSPQVGPVIMRDQKIEKIGTERLSQETIDSIPNGLYGQIVGGWCPYHKLIMWSVPCKGSVKNNCVLPFQYELGAWCATEWDGFGVNLFATGFNRNREQRLFALDYYESAYWLNAKDKFDGITPTMGTVEGATSAASAATSLTSTGFYVFSGTSNNMKGQMVTFVDENGKVIGRREITSNTSTQINWTDAIDLVTGGRYYISTPNVEIGLKRFDGNQPFLRKRFDRLYLHFYADDPSRNLKIFYQLNELDRDLTFLANLAPNSAQTATTDVTWDVPVVVNVPLIKKRIPMFVNGHEMKLVFQYPAPGPVMISKVSIIGRLLNERYYA